ncbi:hypothetical protein WA026_009113 [Henosepilachna vigintioctopunctata]|uniref:Uncharacterized protein n=1 Tax=Henosepilachna vigintioctopunctata TaxID=420089 RepID=A0AAW1UNZ5_9CUCU
MDGTEMHHGTFFQRWYFPTKSCLCGMAQGTKEAVLRQPQLLSCRSLVPWAPVMVATPLIELFRKFNLHPSLILSALIL